MIRFDLTEYTSLAKEEYFSYDEIPDKLETAIKNELVSEFPQLTEKSFMTDMISDLVKAEKRKVVFIIDEWDALIRESNSASAEEKYLSFLRRLFKNDTFTSNCIAAAYMTGILPIKKVKSQSAISDFKEFTVLNPGKFANFIGFDETDIKAICDRYDMDFEQMKKWYDGYTFGNVSGIYNPYSVMNAVIDGEYGSYWRQSSSAESLESLIGMDFDGLQESVAELISHEEIPVNTRTFRNDLQNFAAKDDVLSAYFNDTSRLSYFR